MENIEFDSSHSFSRTFTRQEIERNMARARRLRTETMAALGSAALHKLRRLLSKSGSHDARNLARVADAKRL
ncbi:MAG: hypothetical protein AAF495_02810 [Pseudomonadota bacterium]